MLKTWFVTDVYVKVHKNRIDAKSLAAPNSWQSINAERPFTTERLLVGDFSSAEATLKDLINTVVAGGLIKKSPRILIQPMLMIEGGLCEVEDRIFRELALGAGAHKVALHVGAELSDAEAAALLDAK